MRHNSLLISWGFTVLFLIFAIVLARPLFAADEPQAAAPSENKDMIVVLETTKGNIEIKLLPNIAPKAAENFSRLATRSYYNGILFHRVIAGFMIQGGDPTGTGRGGESVWGGEFEDEVRED